MENSAEKSLALWNKAKKILIVANSNTNKDVLFAALTLLDLALHEAKTATLLSPVLAKNKIWAEKLKPRIDYSRVKSEIPHELSIVIPSNLIQLEGVSYQKRPDGNFEILLDGSSRDESTTSAPAISKGSASFDLILIVGSPSFKLLINSGFKHEALIKQQILFLTNAKSKAETPKKRISFFNGTNKSFSGKLLDMFHINKSNFTAKQLTLILSGIICYTKTFNNNINAELIGKVATLIEQGAGYYEALGMAQQDLTLKKVHLLGQLLTNTEELQPGIYASFLSKETQKKIKLDMKDLFKAAEIHNAEMVMIYFEALAGQANKVYLKSVSNKKLLKTMLKAYQGKGSDHEGMFVTSATYKEILDKFRTKSDISSQELSGIVRNENPLDVATNIPKPLQIKELLKKGAKTVQTK